MSLPLLTYHARPRRFGRLSERVLPQRLRQFLMCHSLRQRSFSFIAAKPDAFGMPANAADESCCGPTSKLMVPEEGFFLLAVIARLLRRAPHLAYRGRSARSESMRGASPQLSSLLFCISLPSAMQDRRANDLLAVLARYLKAWMVSGPRRAREFYCEGHRTYDLTTGFCNIRTLPRWPLGRLEHQIPGGQQTIGTSRLERKLRLREHSIRSYASHRPRSLIRTPSSNNGTTHV
jgi:hypothetical protein